MRNLCTERKFIWWCFVLFVTPQVALADTLAPNLFSFVQNHNSVAGSNFRITPSFTQNVSLFYSSPFTINFTSSSYQNLVTYVDTGFNVTVPKYFSNGTYNSKIYVQFQNSTQEILISTTVALTSTFNVVNTINYTKNMGEAGYILLPITNDGNAPLDVSMSSSSSIVKSDNFKIYVGENKSLPIFYDIFSNTTLGVNNISLAFSYGNENKVVLLYLTVKDNIFPNINYTKFPNTIKASLEFPIKVQASDNVGVSRVYGSYNNVMKDFEKENNFYVSKFNAGNLLGGRNVFIYVNDTSNNTFQLVKDIMVEEVGEVNFVPMNVVQIKKGTIFSYPLMETKNSINYSIKIKDLFYPNSNYSFSLRAGNEVFQIVKNNVIYTNTTYNVTASQDSMYLYFVSDYLGLYSATILFDFPEYVSGDKEVKFSLQVGEMNVLKNKTVIVGDKRQDCSFFDTGFFHNSTYKCVIDYPITTDINNLGLFMTQREYDIIVENTKLKIVEMQDMLDGEKWWKRFYMFVGIMSALYVGYLKWLKPRLRIKII